MFNILLQVLDDGRLTDNKGRVVNFKNTIIIMTSNLGSQFIQQKFEAMRGLPDAKQANILEETKSEVLEMLKKTIRPEFLNRIDDIIMFQPLKKDEIELIVRLQVEAVIRRLAEQEVQLTVTPDAIALISEAGFDPEFGARPVKRALQRLLLNDLSKALLSGSIDKSRPITAQAEGDHLTFTNK